MKNNFNNNNIKYSYKPFIGSSHTLAINTIKKNENKNIAILDIGSSIGMMGHLLKENGFANLEAVEIDAKARNIASKFYNTMYESLENVSKTYDLILLLDVLEHTVNPKEFFNLVISKLNENGTLLLSVPNIAHWYPRLSLLFGNFNYRNKGILDNTHLHFYTRKTIKDFVLSYPSLSIEKISASASPIELFLSDRLNNSHLYKFFAKIRLAIVNLFPTIFGYQHLLMIKKGK